MPRPLLIKKRPVSIRHLRRIIAVARIADGTRRTSTPAATGIITGAHASPRLGFMVLADQPVPSHALHSVTITTVSPDVTACSIMPRHLIAPGQAPAVAVTITYIPHTRQHNGNVSVCAPASGITGSALCCHTGTQTTCAGSGRVVLLRRALRARLRGRYTTATPVLTAALTRNALP
jgi:hypothetical protein